MVFFIVLITHFANLIRHDTPHNEISVFLEIHLNPLQQAPVRRIHVRCKDPVMLRIALGFERDTEQVEDRPAVLITLPHPILPERVCAAGGGKDQSPAAVSISEVERVEAGVFRIK